jgi:hypothetical protein
VGSLNGEAGGDQLGVSASGAGDILKADNRNEVIVGAHIYDSDSTNYNIGKTYVISASL